VKPEPSAVTAPMLQQMKGRWPKDRRRSSRGTTRSHRSWIAPEWTSCRSAIPSASTCWGHANPLEVSMAEMVIVCKAVRRGVKARACSAATFPMDRFRQGFGRRFAGGDPAGQGGGGAGHDQASTGAARFSGDCRGPGPRRDFRSSLSSALLPQTALRYGNCVWRCIRARAAQVPAGDDGSRLLEEAKRLEGCGCILARFHQLRACCRRRGLRKAVGIPVIGGFGGGPWLDGRMRMAHAAIGYAASSIDSQVESYANCRAASRPRCHQRVRRRRASRARPNQGRPPASRAPPASRDAPGIKPGLLSGARHAPSFSIDGIPTRYANLGCRAAALDVLAGADSMQLSTPGRRSVAYARDQAARSFEPQLHLHHFRSAGKPDNPAAGSNASIGLTTVAQGKGAARSSQDRASPFDGRLHGLFAGARLRRVPSRGRASA